MGNEESKIPFTTAEIIIQIGKNLSDLTNYPPAPMLTYLNLANNNVQNLPPNMKLLRNLVLSANNYTAIPAPLLASISTYSILESIDLSKNHIKDMGNILNELPSLRRVNLFGNELTKLNFDKSNIQVLDIAKNKFTDVPNLPESIIALNIERNQISQLILDNSANKLSNFCRLCASCNRIAKFICLGTIRLITLDISRNKLTNLPDIQKSFDRLQQLNISNNYIPSLPIFPQTITEIFASNNKICSLPEALSSYAFISTADFSHNFIKTIRVTLPNALQSLVLADNQIKDVVTMQLNNLTRLFMMENQLNTIPNIQGNNLNEYYLSRNLISSIDITNFSKNVSRIDLSHCKLKTLPNELFTIQTLTHLFIGYNQITELPETVKDSPALVLLQLSGNKGINVNIEYPETLEILYVSDCDLESIPKTLETLPDFIELDASSNKLTVFDRNLKQIKKLILSNNQITEIPTQIPKVEVLDLSYNKLTAIPNKLSLIYLKELDLSYNKIQTFPDSLQLPQLVYLKVQNNPITTQIVYTPFPKLNYIDLSSIKAEVIEPSRESYMYSSSPGFSNSYTHNFIFSDGRASYSLWRGLREPNEDGIVMRCNKDEKLFSVIDGRGGSMNSQYISSKLPNLIKERANKIDEESLNQIFAKIIQSLRKKQAITIPDFAFLYFIANDIHIMSTGHLDVLVINDDENIIYKMSRLKNKPRNIISLNRRHGPVPSSYSEGDSLVYDALYQPLIAKRRIEPKDRWYLILSVSVLDILKVEEVSNIAKSCSNADQVAVAIRSAAYTAGSTDNISVIAIDAQKMVEQ